MFPIDLDPTLAPIVHESELHDGARCRAVGCPQHATVMNVQLCAYDAYGVPLCEPHYARAEEVAALAASLLAKAEQLDIA